MRGSMFYFIWCDHVDSKIDEKVIYYVIKGKYNSLRFFDKFKKSKDILYIDNKYQFMDNHENIPKYRNPLHDGHLIYQNNISTAERHIIQNIVTRTQVYTYKEIQNLKKEFSNV